jgi:acetolactate decarboxylase
VASAGNLSEFGNALDPYLGSRNLFYMFRIDGTFPYVKVRAPPAQEKPYPRLVDAIAQQHVVELRNVTGTIVGTFTPDYVGGVTVPGYHLHFVSADRERGGHVLDLASDGTAQVAIDDLPSFTVDLPPWAPSLASATQTMSSDLAAVEKGG